MSKYTPSGLSISQIKKDAKKLKKESNISLSQALNEITDKYTEFESWNEMQKYFQKTAKIKNLITFKDLDNKKVKINIYENKNVNVIYSPPGTGKSSFVRQISLESNKKILICDIKYNKNSPYKNFKNISIHEYSDLAYNSDEITNKGITELNNISELLDLNDFEILIIDESDRILTKDNIDLIEKIIQKCINNNITLLISTQLLNEKPFSKIEKYISNKINLENVKFGSLNSPYLSNIKIKDKFKKESITSIKINKKIIDMELRDVNIEYKSNKE